MKISQVKAIEQVNKRKWLKLEPTLNENSGIYILTREENGIKYAYVGQAKHILTRLAQHFVGFQHIDLSLKRHKLYSEENQTGWKVWAHNYSESELNDKEQYFIQYMANKGYQLRNKNLGSQGQGKYGLDVEQSPKGYYDGVKQGKKSTLKAIKTFFDKYLTFAIKKPTNKIKERKMEEFKELLNGTERVEEDEESSKSELY